MKKFLVVILMLGCFLLGDAGAQVLSEQIIPTECVQGVYQHTKTGKFFMTYYTPKRELKVASIAKSEVEKYWFCKDIGAAYTVVLQHLKTKDRIVIRI